MAQIKPSKKFVKNPIIGTKFTIAVSSAKGGVGKSTFATNLALALKKNKCKVGLLDADIYGPSLPKLLSINEKPKSTKKTKTYTKLTHHTLKHRFFWWVIMDFLLDF